MQLIEMSPYHDQISIKTKAHLNEDFKWEYLKFLVEDRILEKAEKGVQGEYQLADCQKYSFRHSFDGVEIIEDYGVDYASLIFTPKTLHDLLIIIGSLI